MNVHSQKFCEIKTPIRANVCNKFSVALWLASLASYHKVYAFKVQHFEFISIYFPINNAEYAVMC